MTDLALCQEYHWSWMELQATPEWVVERAKLWSNTLAAWRKAKQEAQKT